jgi:hypothetical protein
MLAQ